MPPRVRLIHHKDPRAREKAERIRAAGYAVNRANLYDPAAFRRFKKNPPDAAVIDLDRQPSAGRDMALAIREAKATRGVALVFVGGGPEAIARVKRTVPDAVYTTWGRIRSSLRKAIEQPLKNPVVPAHRLEGYSGTPLPKKLGIKEDATIALVNGPGDFRKTLGALPAGVTVREGARGKPDLVIWFVTKRSELLRRIGTMSKLFGKDGLWIAWPKKSSGVATDVTATDVRGKGLAIGLVDYKVCAIDATWTGLKFARRKK